MNIFNKKQAKLFSALSLLLLYACSNPNISANNPVNSNQQNSQQASVKSTEQFYSQLYRLSFIYPENVKISENDIDNKNIDTGLFKDNFIVLNNYSGTNFDDIVKIYSDKLKAIYSESFENKDVTSKLNNSVKLKLIQGKNDIAFLLGKYPNEYAFSLTKPKASFFVIATNKKNVNNIIDSFSFAITPQNFLKGVMALIHDNSIFKDKIDWSKWQNDILLQTKNIMTTKDTYAAINSGLKALNDKHSSLWTKEFAETIVTGNNKDIGIDFLPYGNDNIVFIVFPDSPADRGGLKVGDIILSHKNNSDGTIFLEIKRESENKNFNITLNPEEFNTNVEPFVKVINNIGYIEIPGSTGDYAYLKFPNIAQQKIKEIDSNNKIDSWIVDLRRNTGGATWPMLNAIGPILGDGEVGARFDSNGKKNIWKYTDGKVYYDNQIYSQLNIPFYKLKNSLPPVAVLISNTTASAGEANAIAFKGREKTTFIGEETNGRTTGNNTFILSDGAWLNISDSVSADRNDNKYLSPVKPDILITEDWQNFGDENNDKMMKSAIEWLKTQKTN